MSKAGFFPPVALVLRENYTVSVVVFYCSLFWDMLSHLHLFSLSASLIFYLPLSAFLYISSLTWFLYNQSGKYRKEMKNMPLVLLVDCMLLRAVVCHHSFVCMNTCEFSWRLFSLPFFLFCHSISSTFSLFYFHFKGLGGTDVVSNACLLPHCLKVKDDYFLMKPGVLT